MRIVSVMAIVIMACTSSVAQQKWFTLYHDSVALVNDANAISNRFINDVKRMKKDLTFGPEVIVNTQPNLVFYADNTVNLPLWEEVDPGIKGFFSTIAGSEADGEKIFGLMFNGFYLIHELGHALQDAIDPAELTGSYEHEYSANVIAMLYWKKVGRSEQLQECYEEVKKASARLRDPVPAGTEKEQYFTEQYYQAAQDPFVYAYMQFYQFIEIYEDPAMPDFDTFLKEYLKNVSRHE